MLMSRLHLLLLPDEILLRIIGFLDVRDLCSLMCCCHALRQFSCDDSIWSTLVKELLDDGTVATSVRPLLSIDSHTAALPPRELFKGQWRKVFAQLLVRAEEEFRSVDYSSILVADPASQTREAGAGAREAAVLLEALLVGCSDAEMPHFFYNCKFGPTWRGIRYLNTFGELLSLKFSQPQLRLKISVKMFQHKCRLDFSHMGSKLYDRAIIVCIGSRERFMNSLERSSDHDPDMRDLVREADASVGEEAVTPRSLLRAALLDEELAGLPMLLFLRSAASLRRTGKPDMSTGGPVMTAMRTSELLAAIGGPETLGNRLWRIQSCDFGSTPMLGVAAGLEWLHSVFDKHFRQPVA